MFFKTSKHSDALLASFFSLAAFVLSLIPCAATAQQGELFSDNFNLPDQSLIIDWTPFGATGREYWYIENQRLNTGVGNNYTIGLTWFTLTRVGTQGWQNYSAGVDVVTAEELGVIAFAFRWVDNQNFYYAAIDSFKRPGTEQIINQVTLNKVIQGRTVELGSTDSIQSPVIPIFSSGNTNRVEVKANGSSLSLLINGTVVLDAIDSDHAVGTIALGQSFNQIEFDNLVVQGGTNATAAPATGGETFRVLILENPNEGISKSLESDLLAAGFSNVVRERKSNGTFSVYVGQFPNRQAAIAEENALKNKNFITQKIESTGAVQPTASPTAIVSLQTPAPVATAIPTTSIANQLEQIEIQARDAEERLDYGTANTLWANYIALAPSQSQKDYGQKKRQAVLDKQSSDRQNVSSTVPGLGTEGEAGSSNTILYVGIGVGALILIGGIGFFLMRKKDEPAPAPAAALNKPKPGAPKPPKQAAVKQAPITASPPAAEDLPPADLAEVDSTARIRPGQVSRKKDSSQSNYADTEVDLKKESSGSVSIGEIRTSDDKDETEHNVQRNTPKATKKPSNKDKTDSGLSLDFLFEDKKDGSAQNASSDFIIPPRPDSQVTVPQGAIAGQPANSEFFFVQNFEDQEEGETPAGWAGEYEYASLQVVRDDASNGKCMRFEKQDGSGSALFSLNFPDAGGRIIIEFDIRCDDKNKYLLGFYIEKDGNFRQAISTIVHRTNSNSNPTLRLQNESTPYEFGQWSSVKYDLDLPRHLVDGYVDGKPVITAARLAQAPKLVNTFSIRDNLATTGTLLIRNIRVYKPT